MNPNLRPNVFWLKVRTRVSQPSISVRTFSQFTIGHVEHKVQRPTPQLGECPDRPGKAKRLETPHAQGVGVAHDLLIIAVGAFTGTASSIEVMPRLGAEMERTNEARMVFETHAVRVAQ